MGEYNTPTPDGVLGELRRILLQMRRDINELGRPSGTQIDGTVAKVAELRRLVQELTEQTEINVSGGGTFGGIVRADAGLWSLAAYNDVLSSGWHNLFVRSDGKLGYVPSSRRFKQDETSAPDALAAALAMQVITFRYIAAVAEFDEDAEVEWGVIAEDIHALGLPWLVDYDAEGQPLGVKYDRLILAFIPVIQDHERRLTDAGL